MNSSPALLEDIKILESKLNVAKIPPDLHQRAKSLIERLVKFAASQGYSQEYDQVARYLDWIIALPWEKRSQDILSLDHAKKVLDTNHYGLENIKERILEYISVVNLKQNQQDPNPHSTKAPALLLVGLVGTGKTTMAFSIFLPLT